VSRRFSVPKINQYDGVGRLYQHSRQLTLNHRRPRYRLMMELTGGAKDMPIVLRRLRGGDSSVSGNRNTARGDYPSCDKALDGSAYPRS
jgi:hypothetical protein